jgi:hypothetical protein
MDLVLERGDAVVALEVKGAATVTASDLKGLRGLREDLGPRFRLGIVAHMGTTAEALDRSLCACPLAAVLGAVA